MRQDIRKILTGIHHKNAFTASLGEDALSMFTKALQPIQFIEKVTNEAASEDCLRCNGQPFCQLFLAAAYLELEALTTARQRAEEAITGFRLRGLRWNQAMSQWLLGLIVLQQGDFDLARRALQKALLGLSEFVQEFGSEGRYSQAQESQDYIERIKKSLLSIQGSSQKSPTPTDPSPLKPATGPSEEASPQAEAYLTLPWIPIYKGIEITAGQGELRWIEQDIKAKGTVAEVYIEGRLCEIRSVNPWSRRVTPTTGKSYGWVKVQGQSMNDAKPVPIRENDYVLFYASGWPNQNEIVIVAKIDPSSDKDLASYRVKYYSKKDRQLRSMTSLSGSAYDPIDLRGDYRCLGVVIAVAKPRA